jgi:uncharacterized membrane protein YfhO
MESGDFEPRRTVLLEENPEFLPEVPGEPPSEKIEITSYALNTIKLRTATTHDGILVLSEVYYPGWVVYIDGVLQKIYRANWNLRAFPLRAGNHSIDVRFEPRSYRDGFWLTAVTIGLSVCGIVYSQGRKKYVTQQKDRSS